MSDATSQLEQAIDRNAAAVVTTDVAGLTRLIRSRLLARGENHEAGLWLFLPAGQADTLDAMIRTGQSARVTVKIGNQHLELRTPVLERRRAFQLNPTTTTEAIRLKWPEQIEFVQRRSAYRIGVSSQFDVHLQFWRIGNNDELANTPEAAAELDIDVRDLSAAGVGGIWKRRRGEDPVLPSNQRLRVDVITERQTITLDAYVRFLAALPEPEFRRIGVQFMLNPSNILDRQKMAVLNGVTGALQRAELKRLRRAE